MDSPLRREKSGTLLGTPSLQDCTDTVSIPQFLFPKLCQLFLAGYLLPAPPHTCSPLLHPYGHQWATRPPALGGNSLHTGLAALPAHQLVDGRSSSGPPIHPILPITPAPSTLLPYCLASFLWSPQSSCPQLFHRDVCLPLHAGWSVSPRTSQALRWQIAHTDPASAACSAAPIHLVVHPTPRNQQPTSMPQWFSKIRATQNQGSDFIQDLNYLRWVDIATESSSR